MREDNMDGREYRKLLRGFLLTVLFVCANVFGARLAVVLSLPVWLDSVGTVFAAYLFGPLSGAIVGAGSNIISSVLFGSHMIYFITSIAIGTVTGIAARRKAFENFFDVLVLATVLTGMSLLVSMPLNSISAGGMTSNVWGDAVINYLGERHLGILKYLIGQYYVEFLDKTVTVLILYGAVHLNRFLRLKGRDVFRIRLHGLILLLALFISVAGSIDAEAAIETMAESTDSSPDYGSYVQTIYDASNGLPCGEANDIAETNEGIIWIGTYAGLYRYNGYEFRHMDDYDTVKNVNCLYNDREGRLWIGTNDSGLAIAINEKVTNVVRKEDGLPSDSVQSISGGMDGNYYVGTRDGLVVLSLSGGLHILRTFPDIKNVITIDTDEDGRAILVTGDGKLCFFQNQILMGTLTRDDVSYTSACFSRDGKVYAGTSGSEVCTFLITGKYLQEEERRVLYGLSNINDVYVPEGTKDLFVLADSGIGYIDDKRSFRLLNTGSFTSSVEEMTKDYQGNLWFASSRMGLLELSTSGVIEIYQRAGIEEQVVNTVAEWKGSLYCGGDQGLYIVQDDHVKGTVLSQMINGVRIRSICVDDKDRLWLATDGNGLYRADTEQSYETYTKDDGLFGKKVRVVIPYQGGIACGGTGGVSIISEDGTMHTVAFPDGAARVLCLTEAPDGTLLAGTDGDGVAVIANDKIKEYLTTEDGLSSNIVLKLPVDGTDLYAVTSNGICYSEGEDAFTYLSEFPYSNDYDLCFDGSGKVFIPGSAGIYITDADSLRNNDPEMATELLDAGWGFTSGLTANAWNYLDEDGTYYISSNRGVYVLNLNTYTKSHHSYRMRIENITVDGVTQQPEQGQDFSLKRDASRVTIKPEVINYTAENPTIRYRLEGFEENFTELPLSALSEITYTNLPTGEYTFVLSVLEMGTGEVQETLRAPITKEQALYDSPEFMAYFLFIAAISVAWLSWAIFRTQFSKSLEMARKQVQMGNEAIMTIARTLDARDLNTGQHSERVAEYSVMIAREMGFSEAECENLHKAALLHDIGKIGVPDAVLNKHGRLTDEEYAQMKKHVTMGADILKHFTSIDHVVDCALYHHERYDGKGYAHGLKGKEIPLYGRIVGVADAFDAMTANRVYRKQLDIEYVLEELSRCSGTQFDPEIADIMISLVASGKIDVEALYHKHERKEDET